MLDAAGIRKLKARKTRYVVTDAAGLGIEVMPTGRKVWRYRWRDSEGKDHKTTLGAWPALSMPAARARREKLATWVELGQDIAEMTRRESQAQAAVESVEVFGRRYLKEVVDRDRKNPKQIHRILEREVFPAIGERRIADVAGDTVRELIFKKRNKGKPSAAAALRNVIKRMWDYAIVCSAATVNPAHAVPMKFIAKPRSRSRTLSRREVGQFLNILFSAGIENSVKRALYLVLLTLCRKSELRLAQWKEINFETDEWEIPAEHSKTGKPHIVYLSPEARETFLNCRRVYGVLDGAFHTALFATPDSYIFPAESSRTQPLSPSAWNQAMKRINFKMPHFTIHDLRRTAATLLAEGGWPNDVIEKALNHTIKGVRGVYNRAELGPQRREMLAVWGELLDKWRQEYKA